MVWMTTLRSATATTLADSSRAQGTQVPAEPQEPGAGPARPDEPVERVLAQVAGSEQVPDPAVRVSGHADPGPWHAAGPQIPGSRYASAAECRGLAGELAGDRAGCRRAERAGCG
jgi:hypothetical protein